MTKKGIQVAFAITLIIISIIATIWQTELLENIIYAVVIPSFILSVISFVAEIADKCQTNAEKFASLTGDAADVAEQVVEAKMKNYKAGISDMPYVEGLVPKEVTDFQLRAIKYYKEACGYKNLQTFFAKCQSVCHVVSVIGYVLMFLSLILSPYAVKLLSAVDLNCITLWSLTLLYFTLELKSEICAKLFNLLSKRYLKKAKKEIEEKIERQEQEV